MAEHERIPPEILRKVRKIELSTRHMVDDLFGGEYHSVFKGMGMEFDEVREYAPGDEVRSIDWNVTARMGRPFIKRFREERELTVLLVIDASASGLFGSAEQLKSEIIAEVASVLAFSAIRNQDKVGCLIFTDRVEKFIPPEKGHRHVLRIIRELLYFKPKGSGTDLGQALETLTHLLKRKAVVFLVSDFLTEGYETALRLAARRHDLIALNIHDPLESELPNLGLLHLLDAESGKRVWIDSGNRWVRKHFAEEAQRRLREFGQLCGRLGVDEIRLDVTQDYARPLVQFFRRRAKRLAKGIGRGAKGLLLAIGLAAAAGSASAQPAPSPGQPPMPLPGQPGQEPQGPAFKVIPRAVLDELSLPGLDELTGISRPRLTLHEGEGGFRVESFLARDIQAVGQPNNLRWRVILPTGVSFAGLEPELGEPGRIQPWPDLTEEESLAEDLAARLQEGEEISLNDFLQVDTLSGAAADTLVYSLPFTTFQPDSFQVPGQSFVYRPAGAEEDRVLGTEPLDLACISTLRSGPDSTALRDWKAPGELRGDWLPLLARWGLPALLALGLLLFGLFWWLRRRARALAPEIPPIPADEEALEALTVLALADLPGKGESHDYYFELSRILRHYLSRRYHMPFSDWTSEEIREALAGRRPRLRFDPELRDELLDDLDRGDLVKFARRQPSRAECDDSLAAARRLIRATRPAPEAEVVTPALATGEANS